MARTTPLQDSFLGFQRDPGRDQLPKGYAHDILNLLPGLGAPLRKRGGWSYEGALLTDTGVDLDYPRHVAWAPFYGDNQVLTVEDGANHLVNLTAGTDEGLFIQSLQAPIFYRDLLIGAGPGGSAPKKYDGTTIANLGATAPSASNLCVHKDRLLATDQANNRGTIYFSDAGDPTTFDATNRFLTTSDTVGGMASLGNAVIVFHSGTVERIRGSIPPGSAAKDMVLEPLFGNVGLYEPNAFVVADDTVIWADEDGIYQSDGASFSDLTKQGGIKKYWSDQVVAAGASATIAVGAWKGYALVSLLSSGGGYQDFLICDVKTRGWFRADMIRAKNFAPRFGATDELYFSNQSTKRVGELSTIFSPAAGNKTDADTNAILPVFDTAYFKFNSPGKKRTRWLYTTYDLRADSATLDVSFATSPEATSYTAAASHALTTEMDRKRAPIRRASLGAAFRITTSTSSNDLKIYALEAEAAPLEQSRR